MLAKWFGVIYEIFSYVTNNGAGRASKENRTGGGISMYINLKGQAVLAYYVAAAIIIIEKIANVVVMLFYGFQQAGLF